jgi:mRNA interferase RelE/StbE
MIVRIDKSFQKDLSKINNAKVKHLVADTIERIQQSRDLSSITDLKKLAGHKDFYRLRLGNYRIGIRYNGNDELILIRFLHRKDIYQKWP